MSVIENYSYVIDDEKLSNLNVDEYAFLQNFFCSVTLTIFQDPIILGCGHTFDSKTFSKMDNSICPKCRKPYDIKYTNNLLKHFLNIICSQIEQNKEEDTINSDNIVRKICSDNLISCVETIGNKVKKYHLRNDKKIDTEYTYVKKILVSRKTYLNGELHGYYEQYHNNKIIHRCQYKNGLKHGYDDEFREKTLKISVFLMGKNVTNLYYKCNNGEDFFIDEKDDITTDMVYHIGLDLYDESKDMDEGDEYEEEDWSDVI